MSQSGKPTAYQRLVRRHESPRPARKSAEDVLDSLLAAKQKPSASSDGPEVPLHSGGLDRLREKMRSELLPAFEQLRGKYEDRGVVIAIDAEKFLSGGVELIIEIKFDMFGLRLEGTVTSEGIAFHETRIADDMTGVVTTGPMLRTRNLNGQAFREFICERVAQLVRSANRRGGA